MTYISKFIHSFKLRITNIVEENESSNLQTVIEQFWKDVNDNIYPIIEELDKTEYSVNLSEYNLVTFLYRSNEILENVFILAEFNYIDARDYVFKKIENTDVYYKTFALPKNAQATYRIMINDPLDGIFAEAKYANRMSKFGDHPDKLNRNIQRIKDGFVPGKDLLIAWLKPPKAVNQFILEDHGPQILEGKLSEHSHSSSILNYTRKITVYTPKNYDPLQKYPFLLMFDGSSSIKYIQVHKIVDEMIEDGKILPIIVIFVDPGIKNDQTMRYQEYSCNPDFAKSINEEFLPWIQENYSITDNPQNATIAGSSYGGLAAFYFSFIYPDKIKNVISLSGSFHVGKNDDSAYPYEWLPQQVAFSEKRKINAYLEVGKLEGEYHWDTPDFPNQIVSHRHFTTILKMKGYNFTYNEHNGDHSPVAWINPFRRGLLHFLSNK
ncbi:MAG: Enterochelin esterase [Candidatus Heimdallarchaeota archaeon LC_2]|nr:MAG: Enterochelin esterase [Candidatus Heimdallarchaeota archaeon LC_2]